MLFIYGRANENAREAMRSYRTCFPKRLLSNQRAFQRFRWQISETGLFRSERQDTGRLLTTRMTNRGEDLEAMDNQCERSTP